VANRASIGKAVPARRSDRELEGSTSVPGSVKEVSLGDLPDQLGFQVRRVQLWVFREFTRKLARLDVTLPQYSVLTVVDANPGINQLTIASALDIERAGGSAPRPGRPLWQLGVGIAASIGAALASIVALFRVPALRRGRLAT